jgi:hypothetical protein
MLSGETANGAFPTLAVSTMAAIVTNAEVGVNNYQVCDSNWRGCVAAFAWALHGVASVWQATNQPMGPDSGINVWWEVWKCGLADTQTSLAFPKPVDYLLTCYGLAQPKHPVAKQLGASTAH